MGADVGVESRLLRGWVRFSQMVVVAAALGAVAAAAASAQSVAVLGLTSEDGSDEMARQLTDALRQAAAGVPEWQLIEARPLLTQMTLAHDCEIRDAACRVVIGDAVGAGQVIYGTTSGAPQSGSLHAELMLFESAEGEIMGVAARDIPVTDLEGGRLKVHAETLLAELRAMPPPQEPAPVAAKPLPAPQSTPASLPTAARDQAARDGSSTRTWVGYGLLGTAAVSLGLAVYSWTQIDDAGETESLLDYRRRVGDDPMGAGVKDVCEEADGGESYGANAAQLEDVRESCDRGRTFELLQYVFLGAAAVSSGVGLYLVLSDETPGDEVSGDRVDLLIKPKVGRDRAGVSATLRF